MRTLNMRRNDCKNILTDVSREQAYPHTLKHCADAGLHRAVRYVTLGHHEVEAGAAPTVVASPSENSHDRFQFSPPSARSCRAADPVLDPQAAVAYQSRRSPDRSRHSY